MPSATAAVTRGIDEPFELEDIRIDEPRPHEVLVHITAVGMCHTDLAVRAGHTPFPLPAVLGHEGAGVVERVGHAVTGVAANDRVVISFDSCGRCLPCETGRPVQCIHWAALNLLGGSRLDGSATMTSAGAHAGQPLHGCFFGQSSFATLALATERNVVKVSPGAPLERLAPLGCGVQTGAGAILNVLKPSPGSTVAIFGGGAVGLSAALAAQLTGATRIVVVDIAPSRLALARKLGVTDVIDARVDDPVPAIFDLTSGTGAEYTLETSGVTQVLRQAVDALAIDGYCGVVGAPPFGSEASFDVPQMLARNPHIIGINQGASVPRQFIPALIELHLRGRLPFERFVCTFPFADIEQAAQAALAGEVVKPVLLI
ncbi:MAG: NAD(P)-dependent alcohol dehydrogenase [Actinomycetota bacterium]|nr:NAD(P)-dependent alcohol dehydrogenase [Actinomycetota bacterium]